MMTISFELICVCGCDCCRYFVDGLVLFVVVVVGIYFLIGGMVIVVFVGMGLFFFVVVLVGYALLCVGGIVEVSFVVLKDYVCELEAWNVREIRWILFIWYLYVVVALCVGVNVGVLIEWWDVYVVVLWVMVIVVVVQGMILGGVIWWRR